MRERERERGPFERGPFERENLIGNNPQRLAHAKKFSVNFLLFRFVVIVILWQEEKEKKRKGKKKKKKKKKKKHLPLRDE